MVEMTDVAVATVTVESKAVHISAVKKEIDYGEYSALVDQPFLSIAVIWCFYAQRINLRRFSCDATYPATADCRRVCFLGHR